MEESYKISPLDGFRDGNIPNTDYVCSAFIYLYTYHSNELKHVQGTHLCIRSNLMIVAVKIVHMILELGMKERYTIQCNVFQILRHFPNITVPLFSSPAQ